MRVRSVGRRTKSVEKKSEQKRRADLLALRRNVHGRQMGERAELLAQLGVRLLMHRCLFGAPHSVLMLATLLGRLLCQLRCVRSALPPKRSGVFFSQQSVANGLHGAQHDSLVLAAQCDSGADLALSSFLLACWLWKSDYL